MKLLFVPNLGNRRKTSEPRWGAEFFADAFIKHSPYDVTVEHTLNNMNRYDCVWVHNVANLCKGYGGRLDLGLKLARNRVPIVGGVRGSVGLKTAAPFLRAFNAIHTSNQNLTTKCAHYNRMAYTLSSGVKPKWFKQYPRPKKFIVGWAGDDEKNMKNVHLLKELDVPLLLVTKKAYISHAKMPHRFYSKISVLVHPSSHEGSNRVVTEAAASALPIICTNVGHNDQLVHPDWMIGLHKHTVENIKSRLDKLRDPGTARRIGEGNQIRARQFSWPKVIEKATKIIKGAMK